MQTPPLVLLLNVKSRPDRLARALEQCQGAGLRPEIHHATIPADLVERGSRWDPSLPPGAAACFESHLAMMERVIASGAEWAMIIEDDVIFGPDFPARFDAVMDGLPVPWDFVQLGWEPRNEDKALLTRVRRRVATSTTARTLAHRVRPATPVAPNPVQPTLPSWGTHCYLISRTFAERFVAFNGHYLWAPVDWFYRFFLEVAEADGTNPLAYFRTREPIAAQDWSLGSDVDPGRLAKLGFTP